MRWSVWHVALHKRAVLNASAGASRRATALLGLGAIRSLFQLMGRSVGSRRERQGRRGACGRRRGRACDCSKLTKRRVTDINRSRSGSLNTSASAALLIRPMPLSPTRIAPVATLRQLDATIPVTKKTQYNGEIPISEMKLKVSEKSGVKYVRARTVPGKIVQGRMGKTSRRGR